MSVVVCESEAILLSCSADSLSTETMVRVVVWLSLRRLRVIRQRWQDLHRRIICQLNSKLRDCCMLEYSVRKVQVVSKYTRYMYINDPLTANRGQTRTHTQLYAPEARLEEIVGTGLDVDVARVLTRRA